jgi:hypothetical protein
MPRSSASAAAAGHARGPIDSCDILIPGAANTIRILVATDNHVGYAERDPVRGDDSYTTFNEIMELAKERDVSPICCFADN